MPVSKEAQAALNKVAAEAVARYVKVIRSFSERRMEQDAEVNSGESLFAVGCLNRYLAFGGSPAQFLSILGGGKSIMEIKAIVQQNQDIHTGGLEHLTGLDENTMYLEQVLMNLLAFYERVLEICDDLLVNNASESLAEMQDEAQNAVDAVIEDLAICLDADAKIKDWKILAKTATVAKNLLNQVTERINMGEVPAREYPLEEARWSDMERLAINLQERRKQFEQEFNPQESGELEKLRVNVTALACFVLVGLYNVRNARAEQKKAS